MVDILCKYDSSGTARCEICRKQSWIAERALKARKANDRDIGVPKPSDNYC